MHDKRKEDSKNWKKQENAVKHLQRITRKIPPKTDQNFLKKSPFKERNYLLLRSNHSYAKLKSSPLMKLRVDEEIEKDQRELFDLANSIGRLDPNLTIKSHFQASLYGRRSASIKDGNSLLKKKHQETSDIKFT